MTSGWGVNGENHPAKAFEALIGGGNSGSPVLNADGSLVGINFDRVWEGTMSDVAFDPSFCRNISLDVRYLLFVIDRIGGASYLFDEMRFDR